MSILDKIKGALKGPTAKAQSTGPSGLTPAQVQSLKQALESLDHAGLRLAQQALTFVVDGEPARVLIDLHNAAAAEPGVLLGDPGRRHRGTFHYRDKESEKRGKLSAEHRGRFYASLNPQTAPLDVLVRLGKLLAAADGGKSLTQAGSPAPDWLLYLINDSTSTAPTRPQPDPGQRQSSAWDVEFISTLLTHDGQDPLIVLQLAFECKDLPSYYHPATVLLQLPGLTPFMRRHRDATQALLGQLSSEGRVQLAQYFGQDAALITDFAPLLVQLATDSSKAVRTEAIPCLNTLDEPRRLGLLGDLLRQGDAAHREQAAELLARIPSDAARAQLETALATETRKPVQHALRAALNRLDAARDADTQTLPDPPAWTPITDEPLGEAALAALKTYHRERLEQLRQKALAEIEANKTADRPANWQQKHYDTYRQITEDDLRAALRIYNGEARPCDLQRVTGSEASDDIARRLSWAITLIAQDCKPLRALPGFSIAHTVRWILASNRVRSFWHNNDFQFWLERQPEGSVDLRALADLIQRCGQPVDAVADAALWPSWNGLATQTLAADRVWPFFMEHPRFIDEGLGLCPPIQRSRYRSGFDLGLTLKTLAIFPVLPARWLPRVMEMALGDSKTLRPLAQQVLSKRPDVGPRVIGSLTHSKGEIRVEAARWLAQLHYPPAIEAITQALNQERRETVRAAFLTALETLGVDIGPHLTPANLLTEARNGLKAKLPAGLSWFPFDALPHGHWVNGDAVDPDILRWWVILACKLKEPGGNALLTRYLSLLDTATRQALGSTVLKQFIAHDAQHRSLDEGIAYAQATAPQRWARFQHYWNNAKPELKHYYEADYNKSQEQVFEECKQEKMREYAGSAIGEKGILALAAFAPAHEAVTLLRNYMRDHYTRRAQIEALLDAVAAGNDPLVIQLLLGVSRRYRTASVKDKAQTLVQQLAELNGWSPEQLADRTIPTAGLDDTGTLTLHYGERLFTVVLDAALKTELRNPEGKVVKALPAPRQNDDAQQIKEAKTQFQSHKKELKQVIELQTARLYEALCSGRLWPQSEWHEYLLRHPVAGRLIQRLVWLEADATGALRSSFRPTEDGGLINTQDDEIKLAPDSLVRLAHASLLDPDTAAAWIRHFKDYKLTALFPQMTHPLSDLALKDDAGHDLTEIRDRLGWISGTFTLRGAFTKRGYQRGHAEDGGIFTHYYKDFSSLNIQVVIEFSGNALPEENVPAALKTLHFENLKSRRWNERTLPLSSVPKVLLAESHADYLAIAESGAGFDAQWETKMPW